MRKKISPKLFKNQKEFGLLKVKKEQLVSSVLLIGMVKAESEQYVYFDNTIGRNASVTVYVGEEISVAQQLIQYDSTSA